MYLRLAMSCPKSRSLSTQEVIIVRLEQNRNGKLIYCVTLITDKSRYLFWCLNIKQENIFLEEIPK